MLISANNFSEGVVGDKNTEYIRNNINYGPNFAVLDLPTTSQWKNVALSNSIRDIKDVDGVVKVENFSYQGYAARFITVDEIKEACEIAIVLGDTRGQLVSSCTYLLENTEYSSSNTVQEYWTETVASGSNAFLVSGFVRGLISVPITTAYGVRPAIEVLKSNMSY